MANKYSGMTVNERLYASGLIKAFEQAVERKDAEKMYSILGEVGLVDELIPPVVDMAMKSNDKPKS